MKLLAFTVVLFVAALADEYHDPRCPYYGEESLVKHFPHEYDCTKFYKCDFEGHPIVIQCDEGLQYDPTNEICDWPKGEACIGFQNAKAEEEPEIEEPLPFGCPDHNEDDDSPVHLPHPTNCNKFYKCLEGVPTVQDCPPGLHWNIELNYCGYAGEAHCVRPIV